MGEQTQTQTSPPQNQPQPQSTPHFDAADGGVNATPPTQEPPPLPSVHHHHHHHQQQSTPLTSTSSKLPFRPKKIRKLSSTPIQDRSPQPIKLISPRIISRTLSTQGEIDKALRHLRSSDPLLSPIIDANPPPTFDSFHPPFLALTKSILYQQLAFKAGNSIYNRFVSLCGGEPSVLPQAVLAISTHQLRQIGVSARKASYLHDLANKYCTGILSDSSIVGMDDKSLFTMLTMVKGIGAWSVHMFMIFSLHRPDVLPIGDLGVRKGVQLLYGLEQLPRPSQMEQLCEKWRPYRSVASWYMWRFSEAKGAPAIMGGGEVGQLQQPQPQPEMQSQHFNQINAITNLGERGSSKLMLELCDKDMYTGVTSRACAWSQ